MLKKGKEIWHRKLEDYCDFIMPFIREKHSASTALWMPQILRIFELSRDCFDAHLLGLWTDENFTVFLSVHPDVTVN
jgi:hypothetical protein